jgi:periplasmic protein TonB
MFADRQQKVQAHGVLSRTGPALAVIGVHVVLIYVIAASMGIVKVPMVTPASETFFIEDRTTEPEVVKPIKPDIEPPSTQPIDIVDQPVVPIIEEDVPVAPVDNTAIAAREVQNPPATGAPAQELRAKQRVEPVYPSAARRDGEEGTVRLRILVDERGRPTDVQVAQSSGFARLDQAAVDAVRRWRFEAATNGTAAISAWTQVAISFKLTDAQKR